MRENSLVFQIRLGIRVQYSEYRLPPEAITCSVGSQGFLPYGPFQRTEILVGKPFAHAPCQIPVHNWLLILYRIVTTQIVSTEYMNSMYVFRTILSSGWHVNFSTFSISYVHPFKSPIRLIWF